MAVTNAYAVYPYAQVLKEAGKERKRNQADQTEHDRPSTHPQPPTPRTELCTHPMPVDLSHQDSCQRQQFGSPGQQSPWRLLLTYY